MKPLLLALLLCGLLTGCGKAPAESASPPGSVPHSNLGETPPSNQPPGEDCYLQLAAYIQEGMRIYGLDQEITLYFAPWEASSDCYLAEVGVDLENGESAIANYAVSYDGEYYAFRSLSEPFLLSHGPFYEKDAYVRVSGGSDFTLALSRDVALHVIPRYVPVPGPTSGTAQYTFGHDRNPARQTDYYIDQRMGIQILIDYPTVYDGADTRISELVRQAAYHGLTMVELADAPNTDVEIDYRITRDDDFYFSVLFIFYGYSRGSAHPAIYEYAVNIDRTTKQILSLSDVLTYQNDEELVKLITSGAFPELEQSKGPDTPSVSYFADEYVQYDSSDHTDDFYLTEDSLCLPFSIMNWCTILEAPYAALPMKIK